MIIEHDRRLDKICLLLLFLYVVGEIMLFAKYKLNIYSLIWFSVFGLFVVSYSVSLCRVFILDKNGCTVKLGCFQKKYSWKDVKLLKHCRYENSIPKSELMQYGVEFSWKQRKRSLLVKPSLYSFMFAPFSLCYIYFPFSTDGTSFKNYKSYAFRRPVYYLYDEDVFFKMINEWGLHFVTEGFEKEVENKFGLISMMEEYCLIALYCVIRIVVAVVLSLIICQLLKF